MTTSDARLLDVEDMKVSELGEVGEVGEQEVSSLCNSVAHGMVILDDSAVKWCIE